MRHVLHAALIAASLSMAAGVSCLNLAGQSVGWWLILKKNNGLDYAYFDDGTTMSQQAVTLTGFQLDDPKRGLGATIQQVNELRNSLAVLIFNDAAIKPPAASEDAAEKPDSNASATNGHINGLLVADANEGFWISHSLPAFPYLDNATFAWSGSQTYGQHFICLTLSPSDVEVAATQVSYMDAQYYESSIAPGLAAQYPTMVQLLEDGLASTGTHTAHFTVPGGQTFTHFAKSGSWGQDIFEDLVQPALQENFMWETWRRSPVMDSYCQPQYAWDSTNVNSLQWRDVDGSALPFRYTQDHSKYGVATNASSAAGHWVCTADNNRMTSQWARGGGAFCFLRPVVFTAITAGIVEADQCA